MKTTPVIQICRPSSLYESALIQIEKGELEEQLVHRDNSIRQLNEDYIETSKRCQQTESGLKSKQAELKRCKNEANDNLRLLCCATNYSLPNAFL